MKCFECGDGKLVGQTALVEGEIKRKKYMVKTPALVCDACGHIALEGHETQEFMRRVADAYRLDQSDSQAGVKWSGVSQLRRSGSAVRRVVLVGETP